MRETTGFGKQEGANETPLQSWKEIGAYLDRDESTARRWEREAGLPVRRHVEGKRSSVYAYPSEIDAWRTERRPHAALASRSNKVIWIGVAAAVLLAALIALTRSLELGPVVEAQAPAQGIRTVEVCAGCDWIGSISPDGRYITESDWESVNVMLKSFETGESRPITKHGFSPRQMGGLARHVFSPDGSQVAFGWVVPDGEEKASELRVVTIQEEPAEPRLLFSSKDFTRIDVAGWSESGEILISGFRNDWTTVVGFVSEKGGDLRPLKTIASAAPMVRLSPDGKWVTYDMASADHVPGRDVYLLAADGSSEALVSGRPGNEYIAGFTADSDAVLFVGDLGGTYGLWSAPIGAGGTTGEPRLLQRDTGGIAPLGVTPDGSLYFARAVGAPEIMTAEIDFESGRVVSAPQFAEGRYRGTLQRPEWVANGTLVYRSAENVRGAQLRFVFRAWPDGEEREVIPNDIRVKFYYPASFSSDGKRILLRAQDSKDRWGVYSVDAETGDGDLLKRMPADGLIAPVGWAADGMSWFYAGRTSLWEAPVDGGQERQIYQTDETDERSPRISSLFARVSPDGSMLVVRETAARSGNERSDFIRVVSIDTGEAKTVFECPAHTWPAGLSWSPDGRSILAMIQANTRMAPDKARREDAGVFRIPIDGSPALRTEFQVEEDMDWADFSPDGKTIAYRQGNNDTRIFKMENYWSPEEPAASE